MKHRIYRDKWFIQSLLNESDKYFTVDPDFQNKSKGSFSLWILSFYLQNVDSSCSHIRSKRNKMQRNIVRLVQIRMTVRDYYYFHHCKRGDWTDSIFLLECKWQLIRSFSLWILQIPFIPFEQYDLKTKILWRTVRNIIQNPLSHVLER